MNSLSVENENIIKELEKVISELNISKMEAELINKIKGTENTDEDETIFSEKGLYEAREQFGYFVSRICAVNEKAIISNDHLKSRIQLLYQQANMPCSIEYVDMPLNSSIYLVQQFYKKIYEKYTRIVEFMNIGLMPNASGRRLNAKQMEENDIIIYRELDCYINYIAIRNLFNELINLEKNVIFNYSESEND